MVRLHVDAVHLAMARWPKSFPQIVSRPVSALWEAFSQAAQAQGLTARNCGGGHWRLEGGVHEVNWYPFAKKSTIYVNGGAYSIQDGTLEKAIACATVTAELPRVSKDKRDKRKCNRPWRNRLLMAPDPRCRWCQKPLDQATATLDHLVPLARGGRNAPDNYVLACKPCNTARGDGGG